MEKYTTTPKDVWEFFFRSPWPISWAYTLLGLVTVAGLFAVRLNPPERAHPGRSNDRLQMSTGTPTRLEGSHLAAPRMGALRWRLLLLPLAWLVWQCLAAGHSWTPDSPGQLSCTLLPASFASILALFRSAPFAIPGRSFVAVLCGFLVMLASGWNQHFGGLEENPALLLPL